MSSRHLSLTPDASEITRLNRWLDDAFAEAGTEQAVADDLKLCLNEAVTNAILYAFDGVASPEIEIELSADADTASATLTDNGIAFDPLAFPRREKLTSFDDAVGGFGLELIRQTAAAVHYVRRDGTNRLRLICGKTG